MVKRLISWMGFAALAAAMAVGVIDGARSIAASGLDLTPVSGAAQWLLPRQSILLEPAAARPGAMQMWDALVGFFLTLPAVPMLFLIGGLLLVLGRPAAPAAIQRRAFTSGRTGLRNPGTP